MQFNDLQHWLAYYIGRFKEGKEPYLVHRKELHTQAVLANAINISERLCWNDEDTLIAKAIALLHDVGRFPQVEQYGTFRDDLSEDHAEMSVQVIEGQGLLNDWPVKHQAIIKEAVRWHNKPVPLLPKDLDPDTQKHLRLIRDADKIDIIKVVQDIAEQKDQEYLAKASSYTLDDRMSDHIQELVLRDKDIRKAQVRTTLDNKTFLLNWIHQFNHRESISILKEQGRYEAMLDSIPEDYKDVREHLRAALDATSAS